MHTGNYLPTLDGWRALAIVLVLIAHASDSVSIAIGFLDLQELHAVGLFGVQIFFGLSGFLITCRLITEERDHGKISLKAFYIRRAFRIFPASLAFLFVVGLLAIGGVIPVSLTRWLSTLLFMANYSTAEHSWYLGHFWSLAVEEHFYFVWPLAYLLFGAIRGRLRFAFAIAVGIAIWRVVDFKIGVTGASPAQFWGRTDIQADAIAWGVIIALLYSDELWKTRLVKILSYPFAVPSLILFLALCILFPAQDWKIAFMLVTLKGMVIPIVILGVMLNKNSYLFRLFETNPFRHLGKLSYSLYLWQQLFLVWTASMVSSMYPLQTFPLNIIAAFVCAYISLIFIEQPMIKVGRQLDSHKP